MPKSLSLKKAQQNAPPKNQKSITQFFRNTNVPATHNTQSSPTKSRLAQEKCNDSKPLKRKALSPIQVETIELLDEPFASNGISHNSSSQNGLHTPKKYRSDNHIHNDLLKKSPVKKSSHEENDMNIQPSLLKANMDHKSLPQVTENEEIQLIENIFEELNDIESKLTPVEFKTMMKDGESGKVSKKDEFLKSSPNECENHVLRVDVTPKKDVQRETCLQNSSPDKINRTPKKSPLQVPAELRRSPRIAKLKTPEKIINNDLSPSKKGSTVISPCNSGSTVNTPSKSGSTVKVLDFSQHGVDDMFGEEWDVGDMDEECKEDLELSSVQRCEVVSMTRHPTRLELLLKNATNNRATCFVEGIWLDTPLFPGEVVSVIAARDSSGRFCVGNTSGLLTLRPDHLVSSTSVVAGVFCKRKALLQERWRGIDSANTAMTIGILVHELVQKALTHNIGDVAHLRSETDKIVKESVRMLYDAGLSEEETRSNMQMYLPPLAEFMQTYVCGEPNVKAQKDQWSGRIDQVLDIEENLCCPQLGLKGKIDATLQVTIHERKGRQQAIVPLELKSGKASVSAEHRGQLVLYGMMLSLQRDEDPATSLQRGLLLYLKERVDLREVSCGYPERRDLVMLRNQLVQHLASGPHDVDPEQVTDIEDASCLLQQRLPEPVHHAAACAKCPYLTLCSLHLWHTDGPSVSETHPLAKLREQALGHLLPEHIKYFLRWTALLKMEERGQMMSSPLHALWTDSVEKRIKRGTCAGNLKLKTVQLSGERHLHVFEWRVQDIDSSSGGNNRANKGPQEGEFSIVSIDNRPWIAAGVVTVTTEKEISILLERDLSCRLNKDTLFHIDTYESYATTVQNLTNLGVLLEDSDRALRLRRLIIEKDPPQFEKKLPREVGRLGTKLMRSLNIEQQRAVLKALAAKDYALLQGLPGTGKTQTISVLIQMLAALKQRVLVTAHTHSAVDTVLSRLPESLRVMRLGSSARVAARSLARCEQQLTASCQTPLQLEHLYDSMEVVGVTCLGANHAMLARTTFDICIVDEATQVLQCTVLRPLFAAKRFVLVGDPDQLPPVVRSRAARRLGMEESLFHRLMSEDATSTLRLQYRMNQPLADIANRVAYSSRLKCADQTVAQARMEVDVEKLSHYAVSAPWLLKATSPEPEHAALFLDMEPVSANENNSKSCTNIDEACLVLTIVDALIEGGVKASEIGVIAPYRDQVSLLRRVLCGRGGEASTVDQFQGRDKSVIVYSCTKREGQHGKIKEGEILNDQRRLAVSVTRAKHKLLIIGNTRALQRYAPLQRLIDACAPLPIDKLDVINVVNKYRTEFG